MQSTLNTIPSYHLWKESMASIFSPFFHCMPGLWGPLDIVLVLVLAELPVLVFTVLESLTYDAKLPSMSPDWKETYLLTIYFTMQRVFTVLESLTYDAKLPSMSPDWKETYLLIFYFTMQWVFTVLESLTYDAKLPSMSPDWKETYLLIFYFTTQRVFTVLESLTYDAKLPSMSPDWKETYLLIFYFTMQRVFTVLSHWHMTQNCHWTEKRKYFLQSFVNLLLLMI